MTTYNTPIEIKRTEDIVIERHADGVHVKGLALVGARSDRFDYGYRGAGADELAVSILNAFVPACADGRDAMVLSDSSMLKIRHISQLAWDLHHQFADEVLGRLPREEGRHVIKANDVRQWIQQRLEKEQEQEQEQEPEQSRER